MVEQQKYMRIGGMRMSYLRSTATGHEWNTTTLEEREYFNIGWRSVDNFDVNGNEVNPCYDVNGDKTLVESEIKLARKEVTMFRLVCCKPGQGILGGKTLFNLDILAYKRMTHQRWINAGVRYDFMPELGQTFDVFCSDDYTDDV